MPYKCHPLINPNRSSDRKYDIKKYFLHNYLYKYLLILFFGVFSNSSS